MDGPEQSSRDTRYAVSAMVGLFVWVVFDSIALGLVAIFATYWLMKRDDETEDVESDFD